MWNYIKRGFGYGLGGRIGWELGGVVYRWVRRAVLAILAFAVMQCTGQGLSVYSDLMHKNGQGLAAQQK